MKLINFLEEWEFTKYLRGLYWSKLLTFVQAFNNDVFKLLAVKSRDLSQDEKKITVAKAEQIQKMTITFTHNEIF